MPTSLEERIERLERIVQEMSYSTRVEPARDDWQSTVAMFADDLLAKELLDEATQLRMDERDQVAR